MAQQYHQGSWKINNLQCCTLVTQSQNAITHQLSQDKRTAWATRMSYGKATELLSLNDLKLCQNSRKFIVFSLTRETYTNMRTEIQCTPTPPPKLFSNPSPTPLRKLY